MGEQNWLEVMNHQLWIEQLKKTNSYTEKYGLMLSEKDMEVLITEKSNVLKAERRVEFGQSILPQIIYTFCDSAYISQDTYLDTLIRLQEIFFLYKNEIQDEITDDELLNFMREQYDTVCYGDLAYLESTCLEIFGEAIRAGYQDYQATEGEGVYAQLDIVQRWDKDLFLEALNQLF